MLIIDHLVIWDLGCVRSRTGTKLRTRSKAFCSVSWVSCARARRGHTHLSHKLRQQHKSPSPIQCQFPYRQTRMDNTIKLEDESADSTIGIMFEEANGLGADLDRQWEWGLDESQLLEQPDEAYNSVSYLDYETGTLNFSFKPVQK